MDIRNVQKTGNMQYVYLPTAWCKKNKITSKSKVSTVMNEDGTLTLSPQLQEGKKKELILHVKEDNLDILHKVIIASYLAPGSGFKIILDKTIDYIKLLNQKKLISLELVEINKDSITCESSVLIEDLGSLLKTMLRKIRNMIVVMTKNESHEKCEKDNTKQLISRYEEEIDRSQLLLDKSIIEAFTMHHSSQLKTIELHYISLIAKDLERLVDILSVMEKADLNFLKSLLTVIDMLKDIVEAIGTDAFKIAATNAIGFIRKVDDVENVKVKDIATYEKKRAKELLNTIAEVIIDWAIIHELEGQEEKTK